MISLQAFGNMRSYQWLKRLLDKMLTLTEHFFLSWNFAHEAPRTCSVKVVERCAPESTGFATRGMVKNPHFQYMGIS